MIEFRPSLASDRDFLFEVHREAFKPYVHATWGGWDEDEQRRMFLDGFRPGAHDIIRFEGTDIGFVAVEDRPEEVLVSTIEILPEFQRRGIGTHFLTGLLSEAAGRRVPVRLRVLKVNPAKALYERLGFSVTAETDTHYGMETLPRTV